jgi:hypothetical protein
MSSGIYCPIPTILIKTLLTLITYWDPCSFFGALEDGTGKACRPTGTISLGLLLIPWPMSGHWGLWGDVQRWRRRC